MNKPLPPVPERDLLTSSQYRRVLFVFMFVVFVRLFVLRPVIRLCKFGFETVFGYSW